MSDLIHQHLGLCFRSLIRLTVYVFFPELSLSSLISPRSLYSRFSIHLPCSAVFHYPSSLSFLSFEIPSLSFITSPHPIHFLKGPVDFKLHSLKISLFFIFLANFYETIHLVKLEFFSLEYLNSFYT